MEFTIDDSYLEAILELSEEDQRDAFASLMLYGLRGQEPDEKCNPAAKGLFVMFKKAIDEKNKRRANGAKGGRSKNDQEEKEDETMVEPNQNHTTTMVEPHLNHTTTMVEPNQSQTESEVFQGESREREAEREVININNINNSKGLKNQEKETHTKKKTAERDPVPYERIKDAYNNICTSLTAVQKITPKRKRMIRNAYQSIGEDQILEIFRKAEATPFLAGRVTKFRASFDWLLMEDNYTKVIEGTYDDRAAPAAPPDKRTKFDNFEGHGYDYEELIFGHAQN